MDESIGAKIVALYKKEKKRMLFVLHKYVCLCHISLKRRKKKERKQAKAK